MYLKMFGLQEKPFHNTPNPRFIFLSKKHKEAFAHLLYGAKQRVGFLSLIGEVGTGKTTVLRTLLRQLEQANYQVALIFNPCLTALELLQSIHREFGIPYQEESGNLACLHDTLNVFLLEQCKQGKTVVLVIDEAQNLDPVVLEQLRLLSNLETDTDKLIQLIIVGQPELEEVLNRRELRQLKQRLTIRYYLTNMDEEDTLAYIRHRLKIAGFSGVQLFTDKALQQIYRLTGGLPRLINILCDRALLVAYTNEQHRVDHKTIAEAQRELSTGDFVNKSLWPWILALATICTLIFSFISLQTGLFTLTPNQPSVMTTLESAQAQTVISVVPEQSAMLEDQIDPQRLAALKHKIASYSEAESAKIAATAILQLWGKPALEEYDSNVRQPLESVFNTQGLSTIHFPNNPEKLRDFNTPAILSILLPNVTGSRYFALINVEGNKIFTVPALSADGWIPLAYLEHIWFGRAVIPWSNFEHLPYLTIPETRGQNVLRIQELLNLAGYDELEKTGIYDRETILTVSDLQQKHGLNPDGRIGAQTLLQIYRLVGLDMPQLTKDKAQ